MAQLRISAPNVTWDSHTSLVSTGQGVISQATINSTAPEILTTAGFSGSEVLSESYMSDLQQTTVSLQGRMDPSTLGSRFAVTWASGYTANVRTFSPTFNWPAKEITTAGASVDAYEYGFGLMNGTVSIQCILDDTPGLPTPGASGACTFTVSDNDSDTVILTFADLQVQSIGVPYQVGEYPVVDITARINGNVTLGGTETGTLYDSIANGSDLIYNPGPDTLSITEQTNVTHSGEAFVSSLAVTHTIGQAIEYSITAQVTGAFTFDQSAAS